MKDSKKMLKTAGFMAVATFLAKVCGLIRDMMIAGFFGTGMEAEAYLTATRLPTTLFDIVIGGVISSAFIPVFNSVLKKENKEEALLFANRFIGMILLITCAISALGIVFSDGLINFMAPDFDTATHNLARQLSSIMFPMIICTGLAFSFVGILQSFGEYNIPSIMSLVSNLAVIVYFLLFGKKFGVFGLAVTMLVAWSLQVIIQIPSLIKFKFKFRPRLNFKDKNIISALKLALPMLISTWVQPLYTIVNTRIASGIPKGVSSLEYANRLYLVITGVFSFVVTNLMFPKMSRAYAEGNDKESTEMLVFSLKSITFVILPIMAMVTVLAKPIISLLYQHGEFTYNDTLRTGMVLSCYAFGMIGMAYNEILSKAFFSMKNSKTPMINAIISMLANIIVAYTLSGFIGIYGLAVAAVVGSTVNAGLNYFCMNRVKKKFLNKADSFNIVKIAVITLIMAIVMFIGYKFIFTKLSLDMTGSIIALSVCGFCGMAVYLLLSFIFKVDVLVNIFKKGEDM